MDGRNLDEDYLAEHGIRMLPGFSEPYHGRPLTLGEIGCFMSHYNIWQVSRMPFQVKVGGGFYSDVVADPDPREGVLRRLSYVVCLLTLLVYL